MKNSMSHAELMSLFHYISEASWKYIMNPPPLVLLASGCPAPGACPNAESLKGPNG